MNWILQDKNFGLGNFINLTPTIYEMYYKGDGNRIPVYFESDYVKEAFKDWLPIIHLKSKPYEPPILSSSLIDRSDLQEDYNFVADVFHVNEYKRQTCVPVKKLAVFMNGCANPDKVHTKDPGGEIYQYIQSKLKGYKTIFVGGEFDTTYGKYDSIILGDIQLAITLISKADIIISNDTGLYHTAGAMRKKGFILWKDTLFTKNNTPNDNFFRSRKGQWKEDFDTWIEGV